MTRRISRKDLAFGYQDVLFGIAVSPDREAIALSRKGAAIRPPIDSADAEVTWEADQGLVPAVSAS